MKPFQVFDRSGTVAGTLTVRLKTVPFRTIYSPDGTERSENRNTMTVPDFNDFSHAIATKNLSNSSRYYLSYSKTIHLQLDESLKNPSKSVQICPEAFFRVEGEF